MIVHSHHEMTTFETECDKTLMPPFVTFTRNFMFLLRKRLFAKGNLRMSSTVGFCSITELVNYEIFANIFDSARVL